MHGVSVQLHRAFRALICCECPSAVAAASTSLPAPHALPTRRHAASWAPPGSADAALRALGRHAPSGAHPSARFSLAQKTAHKHSLPASPGSQFQAGAAPWGSPRRYYQCTPIACGPGSDSSSDDSDSASSGSSSDVDDGFDDADDGFDDEGFDEDEQEDWVRYKEVDADEDDDADSTDAQVPDSRYALPEGVRGPGRRQMLEEAAAEPDEGPRSRRLRGDRPKAQDGPEEDPEATEEGADDAEDGPGDKPLKQQFDEQLDTYAAKVSDMYEYLDSREGKQLSRKERMRYVMDASAAEDMQIPGVVTQLGREVMEQGMQQLELLTSTGEWCMVIVDIKMTTKQTPQGKKSRFSAMVMVGNLKGKGGYGIGVAKDTNDAIFKALRFAILGAINIPLYRGHTLYYGTKTKFVRTKLSIFPRPSDFGLSASPVLMEACELIGIKDLTVKTHNSRNVRNVVKAFFQAIANIPTAAEIAEGKGVYMREFVTSKMFVKGYYM